MFKVYIKKGSVCSSLKKKLSEKNPILNNLIIYEFDKNRKVTKRIEERKKIKTKSMITKKYNSLRNPIYI